MIVESIYMNVNFKDKMAVIYSSIPRTFVPFSVIGMDAFR